MKSYVLKTTTVVTKELYVVEVAAYLDPLHYISSQEPKSTITERSIKADVFRIEEAKHAD